jgi:hypothetical protein
LYSSFSNQSINIAHYLFAFVVLCILIPIWLFRGRDEGALDRFFKNYLKIVFFIILSGYLLVIVKLYEFIGICMALIGCKLLLINRKTSVKELGRQMLIKINSIFYDILDHKVNLKQILSEKLGNFLRALPKRFKETFCIEHFLLAVILIGSLYLRIYNALFHAAPSMSDSSVTLAWMKYIENRILFHDGIYPQGFSIYLATLHKFSSINHVYVLNYSGPVSGLLTTLGLYFFVSRFTGSRTPALVSAAIFGMFGNFLMSDWMRQAATNSQEFAFLFLLPTFFFYYRYLMEGKRTDLVAAFSGLCVIGLVHTIALVFAGVGMVLMVFAFLVTGPIKNRRKLLTVCASGPISVIIAVLPLGIGLLLGCSLHESSAEFLTSTFTGTYFPEIRLIDWVGFAGLAVIALYTLVTIRKNPKLPGYLFLLFYGAVSYLIVYFGPILTRSTVVEVRFGDMWNLFIPVIIGVACYIVFLVIRAVKIRRVVQISLAGASLVFSIVYFKPQPIAPTKVQSDQTVEQYLKICSEHRPTEWHLVSDIEGGYAMTYGYGYHIEAGDFMQSFDPKADAIRDLTTQVILPNIFIYYEKVVFPYDQSALMGLEKTNYDQRVVWNQELGDWVKTYQQYHNNMSIYYEDEHLIIYYIQQGSENDLFKALS